MTGARRRPSPLAVAVFDTPFGPLEARARDELLTGVRFCWGESPRAAGRAEVLEQLGRELERYCAGEATAFSLPLAWSRLDGLRREVLEATVEIPYGETSTYGRLADRVDRPGQARAVGGALRSNPWVLIVPCHRVVAADGALTGYGGGPRTGGRLDVKAALLAHEREWDQPSLFGPLTN